MPKIFLVATIDAIHTNAYNTQLSLSHILYRGISRLEMSLMTPERCQTSVLIWEVNKCQKAHLSTFSFESWNVVEGNALFPEEVLREHTVFCSVLRVGKKTAVWLDEKNTPTSHSSLSNMISYFSIFVQNVVFTFLPFHFWEKKLNGREITGEVCIGKLFLKTSSSWTPTNKCEEFKSHVWWLGERYCITQTKLQLCDFLQSSINKRVLDDGYNKARMQVLWPVIVV